MAGKGHFEELGFRGWDLGKSEGRRARGEKRKEI
jgi:hypothetical protein